MIFFLWFIGWMFTCGWINRYPPKVEPPKEYLITVIAAALVWPSILGEEMRKSIERK